LGKNLLQTEFPLWVEDLPDLRFLDLGQNTIEGEIPDSTGPESSLMNLRTYLQNSRYQPESMRHVFSQHMKSYFGILNQTGSTNDKLWIHSKQFQPIVAHAMIERLISRYIKTEKLISDNAALLVNLKNNYSKKISAPQPKRIRLE
jgi:hypothetical protein